MGQKLRMARKRRLMSQEKLSEIAGVSRTTISHLENHPNAVTTTHTLLKLGRVLGMDLSDFFTA